ncbi:glycine dehydrogenase [Radiomyces spectabilis]|uniref:glycine dehydrogenase n=1 Tax=Radiomyces spectabilis TaxID=64574 RepID=UPI0022205122|nr:glycine dehydrogenase [Radiomyces spectabilis]KAI8376316.1 glycine dehydrogenase [Radiomyces spectabilis]
MLSRIALRSRGALARMPVQAPRLVSLAPTRAVTANYTKTFVRLQHTTKPLAAKETFAPLDTFPRRHIGPKGADVEAMLKEIGVKDVDELLAQAIPSSIRSPKPLAIGEGITERDLLERLKAVASKNKVLRSYIGTGYTNTVVPNVILRNVMENPAWYTQYTPYQPEISQGRLESLLNFQTMVTDLTGMEIANASLLDEGTAAAEAMLMTWQAGRRKKNTFIVDVNCHPQTIACVQMRAESFNINVVVADAFTYKWEENKKDLCGVLLQYPNTRGTVQDYEALTATVHKAGGQVAVATDLLALTLLKAPGEFGADIALGNSQRFGVPLGFGGPHAAFFACKEEHKRRMPGRLVGVSKDASGNPCYRLALQTREQHIRREKATSNICTAQALLANMSAMYAVYHGPEGLKDIAQRIHNMTAVLAEGVRKSGFTIENDGAFFDTLSIKVDSASAIIQKALDKGINLRSINAHTVSVQLDETVTKNDVNDLLSVFQTDAAVTIDEAAKVIADGMVAFPPQLKRTSKFLQHEIFNTHHSETEMLRYIHHLQSKDLSLVHSMIALGSCTMKLNATSEMIPVTWPEFANIHPFAPVDQTEGYRIMLEELEKDLEEITGFDAVSLQPNSGAQGEYAGLRCIRSYHEARGDSKRNVCLIPISAHGTNPASAAMAGMDVVIIKCDDKGNLDMDDLKAKAEKYQDRLAAIMITYPSTFGIFERGVAEACEVIHKYGGLCYMDGANLNAQIGLTKPAEIGADVCHMNLHKTFCIPHGGGGPGMGPIGVRDILAPYLPGHPLVATGGENATGPVSAAPYGSASILPISWAYIKMMGGNGLTDSTKTALLSANYMMSRLAPHYEVLYTNENGKCGHEFIVDIRPFIPHGIEAIDVAKRLQDYGFHSPTMSFPVANTLMIEPTESESKAELDRFCDAMIQIRQEIQEVIDKKVPKDNNVLSNSPHSIEVLTASTWNRPYSRELAAFPMAHLREKKFWPSVSRVDDAYGDRNLICTCPSPEEYLEE